GVRAQELIEQPPPCTGARAETQLHQDDRAQIADRAGTNYDRLVQAVVQPAHVDIRIEDGLRHRPRNASSKPPIPLPRRSTRTIRASARTMSRACSTVSCSVAVPSARRARSIFC